MGIRPATTSDNFMEDDDVGVFGDNDGGDYGVFLHQDSDDDDDADDDDDDDILSDDFNNNNNQYDNNNNNDNNNGRQIITNDNRHPVIVFYFSYSSTYFYFLSLTIRHDSFPQCNSSIACVERHRSFPCRQSVCLVRSPHQLPKLRHLLDHIHHQNQLKCCGG